MSSNDDTDSTEESDSKSDAEHDSYVYMSIEDHVDAPYYVNLDSNVDMEWDGDNEEEEDEEEKEEQEEDEDEDQNEDEDGDENDDKELRKIGQGEMVNTSADNVDTMVDEEPTGLSEKCQGMPEYTT